LVCDIEAGLRQSRVIGFVSCGNACRLASSEASW
jgi:hypothetical protein